MEAGRFQNGTYVSSWLVQAHVRDTVDQCVARGWPDQAEHRPQRRGLAGTVGPDEARNRAWRHVETEVVDRGDAAEPLGQTLNRDGGHEPLPSSNH
jgi:hypothetical protein